VSAELEKEVEDIEDKQDDCCSMREDKNVVVGVLC
jgi:hypothetical protein